jgi:hypothetical protein
MLLFLEYAISLHQESGVPVSNNSTYAFRDVSEDEKQMNRRLTQPVNSLGAGGEEKPYLVNGANALTFCLMVVSCFFSPIMVRAIGIKWTLIFGTLGYAPFAAGLYTNNRFGTEWLVLFGAALCGISAGVFWMAEAAIALSYPEPYNQGKFLGLCKLPFLRFFGTATLATAFCVIQSFFGLSGLFFHRLKKNG